MFRPNTNEANQKLDKVFEDLVQEQRLGKCNNVMVTRILLALLSFCIHVVLKERVLEFLGRELVISKAAGKLALFEFKELCERPLSAADYLELCTHFDTLFIKNVPQMSIQSRTAARRFITMVDTLYDHKVKVICTAEVGPGDLFRAKPMHLEDSREFRDLMDDLNMDAVSHNKSIYTVYIIVEPPIVDPPRKCVKPLYCFRSQNITSLYMYYYLEPPRRGQPLCE